MAPPPALVPAAIESRRMPWPDLLRRLVPSRLLRRRQGIVLALGGGGARGLAHLGVIQVIEEAGIPVSGVVGASAGAMVGAMWLTMGEAPAMVKRWREFLSSEFPSSLPDVRLAPRVSSRDNALLAFARRLQRGAIVALALERLSLIERKDFDRAVAFLLPEALIEELPLPFAAVATDFHSGRPVLLRRGSLRLAVAASSAVPAFIPPYRVEGRWLMDGGVVSEVPVREAREIGRSPVVAVDVTESPGEDDPETTTVPRALARSSILSGRALVDAYIGAAELVIRPDVGKIHWSEFVRLDEALAAGRTAGRSHLARIRTLAGM
jgi:NTE family protein